MGKDYYAILGLSRDSTEKEVKSSYKRLAVKHHPDKNPNDRKGAEERFKDIAEAYEVLVDKQKRAVFDQHGEEGLKGHPGASAGDFSGGPGGPGGMGGMGGMGGGPSGFSFSFSGPGFGFKPSRAEDIFASFFGGSLGGFEEMEDGSSGFRAGGLGGLGGLAGLGGLGGFGGGRPQQQQAQQAPPVVHKLTMSLEDLYTGTTKKMKINRIRLENGQPQQSSKIVEIDVKKGWKSGTKITFEKEGDEAPGVIPADIVFVVEEQKHPRFERRGHDLVHRRPVTLTQALIGAKFEVGGIDGSVIVVDCTNDILSPNFRKIVPNKGMPKSKSPQNFGNLIVEFDVVWPQSPLNAQQKKKIIEANL